MIYLLDTNICIYFLNKRSEILIQRFRTVDLKQVAVCSVVKAELFYGALKSNNPAKNLKLQRRFLNRFKSFPFDDRAADMYAQIRARLEKSGTPIGPNDLFIAAIAIANDLTLITHNTREFSRIEDLSFEDWTDTGR